MFQFSLLNQQALEIETGKKKKINIKRQNVLQHIQRGKKICVLFEKYFYEDPVAVWECCPDFQTCGKRESWQRRKMTGWFRRQEEWKGGWRRGESYYKIVRSSLLNEGGVFPVGQQEEEMVLFYKIKPLRRERRVGFVIFLRHFCFPSAPDLSAGAALFCFEINHLEPCPR